MTKEMTTNKIHVTLERFYGYTNKKKVQYLEKLLKKVNSTYVNLVSVS